MLNPFRSWIAGDAWEPPEADVGEIGADAFQACCRAITATISERRTTAVLVRGAPGSGKTHLMRRLRAHIARHSDPHLRDTLFVYIRLSTTAGMMWRHLRRRIVDDLLRASAGPSQLECLLYRVLARPGSHGRLLDVFKREWPAGLPWEERAFASAMAIAMWHIPGEELARLDLYDQMDGEAQLPPALLAVLRRIVHRQHAALARGWLRGDSLTSADLAKLGVAEESEDEADAEDAAREMVLMLARLAGFHMPMALCFDQVEALETAPGDASGFLAFGGAVSTLHDETRNLTLISCMQSSTEQLFRRADYDRMAEFQARLPLLARRDAYRLVQARLDAWAPGAEWRVPAEFDAVFDAAGQASARSILAKAAELFERGQRPAGAPARTAGDFLRDEWDRRVDAAAAAIDSGDIDEVLDQGLQALLGAAGSWKTERGGRDVDFAMSSGGRRIDVSLCNQRNMNGLAARLRRLNRGRSSGAGGGLVMVRDPRLAISRTARRTREYLEELDRAGARLVHPSLEAMQALEALRGLLADARSGDLTRDGEPISPSTVQDWIASNLPSSLEQLLDEMAAPAGAADVSPQLKEDFLALLEDRCLVTVEEAAKQLGQDAATVRRVVAAHRELAGVLEGPPALLYRLAPAQAEHAG